MRIVLPLLLLALTTGCVGQAIHLSTDGLVRRDTLTIHDRVRARPIPIAIYKAVLPEKAPKLVLLSHGYNENLPGTYLRFSSMAEHLARNGHLVVSIQHELPTDPLLAMNGDLATLRRPNWERGVENIHCVLLHARSLGLGVDTATAILIGHSNGGDMSLLFATLHPELVDCVVTLDNRRMPLPRTSRPRICSVRANDVAADPGVLPDDADRDRYGIRIVELPGIRHVEMNDRGTAEQRTRLNTAVLGLIAGGH